MRIIVVCAALAMALTSVGCEGKTVVKADPQTAEELAQCQANRKEKDSYIDTLSTKITELENGGVTALGDGEIVVTIEGEVMTIASGKGKGPNGGKDPKGNAKDAELYEAFVKRLKGSRGAIKKCYQHALKKDSALSSKTVTLNIGVSYKSSGKVKQTRFSPRVSEQFNSCMNSVAKKWSIPGMPRPVSFNYKQTLTPE
ncbi:MAG: hypothetical protein GY811_05140 [Myxococcales bacterium]|nr:hypothetical protein [Myxococcales bacterium]